MLKNFLLVLSFLFFGTFNICFAAIANPDIIKEKQPDGTDIDIRLCGDEFYSWYEDSNGYTIIKDTQTEVWSYAQKNSFGELEPSQKIVGKTNFSNFNMAKSLKDENKIFKAKQNRAQFNDTLQKSLASFANSKKSYLSNQIQVEPAIGAKVNFVLLIQFSDLKFKDNIPFKYSSERDIINGFNDLFNRRGYNADGAVGSVKDYFYEISYHKMEYQSVIAPIIVTLDDSYREYSWSQGDSIALSKVQKMIRNALKKIDEYGFDFKSLWPNSNTPEGFSVIHAGGGAESGNLDFIWSHKSSIEPITLDGITFSDYHIEPAGRGRNGDEGLVRIGVICHESLHFFGLPDLYDTTYITGGLGKFCIMASGEWNGSQGNRPAHPCAWSKYKLNLIECQTAFEGLNSIGESASDDNAFYIFKPSGFDVREYFLMENRQSVGFDRDLPGDKRGLLIYHVDERQKSNNYYNSNYLVQLEEAGSRTSDWRSFPLMRNTTSGSDSDYFRNSTISYFGDICTNSPNSKSYNGLSSGIKISEISASSSLMTFMYGKEIVIVDDLVNIVCYPNPARKGVINIINLPTNVKDFSVEIFTLTSKLVRSFSSDDTEYTTDGFRKIKWDCKNDSGEDVAPGVYLVLVKNNSNKKVFKVAVIR